MSRRDHGARAELADELNRDVTDAADPDDGSRRSREEQRREPADGVIGRHTRVGVRRHRNRVDVGGKRNEGALGHAHLFGETTVDREPRELVARAMHVVAAAARQAQPAAERRVDEHRIAGNDRRDSVADRLDPPRVLVSEHERERDAGGLHQAVDRVQIRRAHSGSRDPDDDVRRRLGLRGGPVDQLERLVVLPHDSCLHAVAYAAARASAVR